MEETYVIFTQIIERPARKLILLRGKKAGNYFDYCEETGCGKGGDSYAWDVLTKIKEALFEPVGLWLPDNMRPDGTGVYAHGVEVAADYDGEIPNGFDVIDLIYREVKCDNQTFEDFYRGGNKREHERCGIQALYLATHSKPSHQGAGGTLRGTVV